MNAMDAFEKSPPDSSTPEWGQVYQRVGGKTKVANMTFDPVDLRRELSAEWQSMSDAGIREALRFFSGCNAMCASTVLALTRCEQVGIRFARLLRPNRSASSSC